MTWREVIERYYSVHVSPENREVELGITVADLDKPAHIDSYIDGWCRSDSPCHSPFCSIDSMS